MYHTLRDHDDHDVEGDRDEHIHHAARPQKNYV
jgi:hypothetical protein